MVSDNDNLQWIILLICLYYRVIALILVNIVPSWDIEGHKLAIILLLYNFK